MASHLSSVLSSDFNGAVKARESYSTNFVSIMTTLAGLMGAHFQIQVIFTFKSKIFPDILPNGSTLRILPVGIQHSVKTKSILGNGVIIDAKHLLNDLRGLTNNGIDIKDRLYVSNR